MAQRPKGSFYSKLVRLKVTIPRTFQHMHLFSFYSKLVRLKERLSTSSGLAKIMFLFQTGAIKSPDFNTCAFVQRMFLFQTGAIKSSW